MIIDKIDELSTIKVINRHEASVDQDRNELESSC